VLELKNVCQKYGRNLILNNISYKFQPGKIYGIIGPNGAGKSTLLRILSGFEKSTTGAVFLQGEQLLEPNFSISCMWQKPYLFQTTVYNNIAYGLKIRGFKRTMINDKLNEIIKQFRLEKLVNKLAIHLSGGESARVALARTVACDSPIIILDEPAANLDPPNTRMIEKILAEVQKERNLTIIIVTHDMFQARRLAHYTLFMEDGVLKEANLTEEFFTNPQELSTQRFLQGLL